MKEVMTIKKILEINQDFIRGLRKEEKANSARILIQDITTWATYTNYDAVGLLDVVKQHFIINAEDVREEPKQVEKRIVRRIT